MKTVNRYTRAGADGKMIACPHCDRSVTVYHFAWSAIVCQHCKTPVEKHEWAIACDCTSRGIGEACKTRQSVAV
jgi:uncharacterized CHY-type Zn-finger protein